MEVRNVKIITLQYPHQITNEPLPQMVMALGYFDGIHLGHQAVIKTAGKIAEAENKSLAVMTFDPHPSIVLQQEVKHVRLLTPLEEKMALFKALNVDFLFIVKFSETFAALSPKQFVQQYLCDLNVVHVVAGFDYRFGQYGAGNMENMLCYADGKFEITTVAPKELSAEKISSTRIRAALMEGDCALVEQLLGRHYAIKGVVVYGDQRGRTIGFPTANLEINEDYYLPKVGVYAVKAKVDNHWYNGICNLGFKPTFSETLTEKPIIEVHILDFDANIYGKMIEVSWYKHIRDEKKFTSVDQLITQINQDKQLAIEFFKLGESYVAKRSASK